MPLCLYTYTGLRCSHHILLLCSHIYRTHTAVPPPYLSGFTLPTHAASALPRSTLPACTPYLITASFSFYSLPLPPPAHSPARLPPAIRVPWQDAGAPYPNLLLRASGCLGATGLLGVNMPAIAPRLPPPPPPAYALALALRAPPAAAWVASYAFAFPVSGTPYSCLLC